MRLDGTLAVMIGKRLRAVRAENGAALVRSGQDIAVGLRGCPQ